MTRSERASTPARVLLVEDHALLAQSLSLALRAESLDVTIASLTDSVDLLAQVRTDQPDVVLLDLDLGDQIGDGMKLIEPIAATGAAVLVVTAATDRLRMFTAIEEGAVGVIAKSEPFEVLLETVLRVVRGEQILSTTTRRGVLLELRRHRDREQQRRKSFERLTPREVQVLHGLAAGKTVGGIAAESVVSEATVRSQVRGVLTKLGVTSQLEAVALASRSGWLDDGSSRIPEQRGATGHR